MALAELRIWLKNLNEQPRIMTVDSFGATNIGDDRYRTENQDAFFSVGQGFFPSGAKREEIPSTDTGIWAEQISQVINESGIESGNQPYRTSRDEVLNIRERIQKLIKEGHISDVSAVSDGFGNDESGSLASNTASFILLDYLSKNIMDRKNEIPSILQEAFSLANKVIHKYRNIHQNKMGTALCALVIGPDSKAYSAQIGDSRIYHIRKNPDNWKHKTVMTTTDTSDLWSHINAKSDLTAFVHDEFKLTNRLLFAVGSEEFQPPMIQATDINKGDVFILCTDGVWKNTGEYNDSKGQIIAEATIVFRESMAASPEDKNRHLALALGMLFDRINLHERKVKPDRNSTRDIANKLTRSPILDNATAVAVRILKQD